MTATVPPRVPPPTEGARARSTGRLIGVVLRHPAVVPLGAILVGLLVGAAVIAAAGLDPVTAYATVLSGALDPSALDYTVSVWTFVIGMGLAAAIPLRLGEFNLGGNGQLVLGGLAATVIAADLPVPGPLRIPIALLGAAVLAGLFGAFSGVLAASTKIPIIISTLLLSPVAVAVVSYLVRFPLGEKGSGVAQTPRLPEEARLVSFGDFFYTNWGSVVILVALALFWLVDSRAAVGFEMRVIGANRRFADYAGIRVTRLAAGAMAAGGAAAGIVGGVIVLSSPYRLIDGALVSPGYTFAGVAAALLAGGRPALLPLTAALFAILQVGGAAMERDAQVPQQVSDIVQGVIIVVLALRTVIEQRRTARSAT